MTLPFDHPRVQALLLDIEGTTTPVEFVYGVLFPYARQHVKEFLRREHASAAVRADLEVLRAEHAAHVAQKLGPPPWRDDSAEAKVDSALAYIHWLMDRDAKSTPLKSLQGKICEAGYRSGELHSEVYADVPPALRRWKTQKKAIAIFSSGSVLAQQLLFANTTAGDLTRFLDAYFDTTTGAKGDAESYRRIAAALKRPPGEILFLSDVVAELDAAKDAGMATALCVRPGRPQPQISVHPVIHTFDEIFR